MHSDSGRADKLGLGHLVVPTTDYDATIGFYRDVLGFHTRGAFPFPAAPGMPPLRIQFMGVNPRHHSFAVMPAPHMGPGIVHIMLEVAEMDMVARAMERTTEHGFGRLGHRIQLLRHPGSARPRVPLVLGGRRHAVVLSAAHVVDDVVQIEPPAALGARRPRSCPAQSR